MSARNLPLSPSLHEKLPQLLEALPDMIFVLDAEAHVLWANSKAEEVFGRTLNESYGISGMEFVHPDDIELVLRSLETIQNKEVGSPLEIRLKTPSGWKLVELIGTPVSWFEKGAVVFSIRDLTERRRFEVAGDQVSRFRSLVQNAAAITLLVSPSGRIDSVSGALARVLGHDPELVENEPLEALVAETDRAAFNTAMESALQGATSAHPVVVEVSLLRHESAEAVPFELTFVNLIDDPTVGGLVVTAHDIAAKRTAELELHNALSLLRATLNSTADGILVVDRAGRITSFNRRFVEMWSIPESILATRDDHATIQFVVDKLRDPEAFLAKVEELYEHPDEESTDTIAFQDGRVFERFSRPQYVETEVVGRVWSFRDITESDRTQHLLAESNRRFQALIKSSGDLFALTDAEGIVSFLDGSVEDLFGLAPGSMVGASLFDLLQGNDAARARVRWQQVMTSEFPLPPADYWIVTPAGTLMCFTLLVTNSLDDPDLGAIVVTARDVTQSKLLEEARRALMGASTALVHAHSEDELFDEICAVVVDAAAYELAWVGLIDRSQPLGVRMVASGGASEYVEALQHLASTQTDRGPLMEILTSNQLRVIQEVKALAESVPCRELTLQFGYHSLIALPLSFSASETGVLAIYSAIPNVFTRDAVRLLSEMAGDLSYGIEGLRARAQRVAYQDRFEASLEATVEAIATASELRDPYNAGHQHRVAELAVAIARDMGLDEDVTTGIGVAASIHDIGKVVVPAEILSRPGRLSINEFALVKEHSQAGHDIVAGIAFPWPIAKVILDHHERLNGSGYPNGLLAEEINLETRIVSVADVVEAMQSHRPYRPGLGLEAALGEIERGRDTLFDPDVVDSCSRLFREGGFSFATAS